jgi:hypothetical protein
MPYRTVWVTPEVFIEYRGVTIYRMYIDDQADRGPDPFRFTCSRLATVTSAGVLDVRDVAVELGWAPPSLTAPDRSRPGWASALAAADAALDAYCARILRAAIDAGVISCETPRR